MKAIAIVSGGLDSVTLAHVLAKTESLHSILTFDYGQRHAREIEFAALCATRLEVPHDVVRLHAIKSLLAGSALTDDIPVPEGHYADESMKQTVVPNRNAIMLSIATAAVVSRKADALALGVHAGDHPIYPDCRPAFVNAFTTAMKWGNEGFIDERFKIVAPFIRKMKHEIVVVGAGLHVPFEQTWSCYVGKEMHCGRCGTCVERREAFTVARVDDPTKYALPPLGQHSTTEALIR